ncbi:hypothetical protein [Sorangium sp. So ce233]|uniref:hypothetical protein n=1 Tax=Sorangium sp. So ce233 TaxID=3133290 RepID=UPI003F638BD2
MIVEIPSGPEEFGHEAMRVLSDAVADDMTQAPAAQARLEALLSSERAPTGPEVRAVVHVCSRESLTVAERVHIVACWLLWGMPPPAEFYTSLNDWRAGGSWGDDEVATKLARAVGFERGSYLGHAHHQLAAAAHLVASAGRAGALKI